MSIILPARFLLINSRNTHTSNIVTEIALRNEVRLAQNEFNIIVKINLSIYCSVIQGY